MCPPVADDGSPKAVHTTLLRPGSPRETSIPPLPALRTRPSFLPAPEPDHEHEEDDTNYNWQNCADRGAAPNRCAAPGGVMVGEGRGGGGQDYAGVDHQPAVADDIRTQNGGKPAFDALPCHGCVPRFVLVMADSLGKAVHRV